MKKEKYFVIGFRKIHDDAEFKNKIVGHNHRNRHYIKSHKNIDWSRTNKNIILDDLKFKSEKEIREYAKSRLAKGKRQLQKNKAFAFEIVVDCTPDPTWTEQDYIRYLKDSYEYLKKRFENQTIASAVIHLDEGKPHLHITFLYFNEKEGKWNQKDLMKKKVTDLNSILNDFQKAVGRKYNLNRGKGKELDKPLKKALAKAVEEKTIIEKKLGFIPIPTKEKVINTNKAVKAIRKLNNKYKKALYENEHLKEQLIEHRKKLKDLENKANELERENLMLSRENEDIAYKLRELERKVNELKIENERLKKQNIEIIKDYQEALKIAAQERQLRLSKQINKNMLNRTIEQIKKDYNISR